MPQRREREAEEAKPNEVIENGECEYGELDYRYNYNGIPIEDRLQEGQDILVQVAKEPIGSKGARITTHITLPGRNLVFMPTMDRVGVSRRIEDEDERKRLREVMCEIKPPHRGFIVRTVAEGAEREKLQSESDFVAKLWQTIQRRSENAPVPSLIYQETRYNPSCGSRPFHQGSRPARNRLRAPSTEKF